MAKTSSTLWIRGQHRIEGGREEWKEKDEPRVGVDDDLPRGHFCTVGVAGSGVVVMSRCVSIRTSKLGMLTMTRRVILHDSRQEKEKGIIGNLHTNRST